jgi:hypothetical protein
MLAITSALFMLSVLGRTDQVCSADAPVPLLFARLKNTHALPAKTAPGAFYYVIEDPTLHDGIQSLIQGQTAPYDQTENTATPTRK